MANDANAVDTEERSATVFAVVITIDNRLEDRMRAGALGVQRIQDFFADDRHHKIENAFTNLEHDVADEAVRYHDVANALVNIAPFYVAREVIAQSAGIEQGVSFFGEVVPFLFFGADIHQADFRVFALENVA